MGLVIAVAALTATTACTSAGPGGGAPSSAAPAPPATFAMTTPKQGVDAVLVKNAVEFTAKGGTIDGVALTRADGTPLPGTPDAAGLVGRWTKEPNRWRLAGVLGPRTTYTATVTGRNGDGEQTDRQFTFTTKDAPLLQARMNPGDDNTVGVGMPIQVRFSAPVPDRATMERRLSITTTPKVVGGWGWVDDRTVYWRPKTFWPAGTRVRAGVDAAGRHLGRGRFGGTPRSVHFTVGRDLRMSISNDSLTMTVTQGGKRLESFPVSMGKPGHTTRSGTKIIYEKQSPYTMRGEGADPYVTTVKHAQRLTDSGEFLHAAPWSVGAQGRRNVSHGCVNLSPGAAAWLYSRTLMGDPVITTGTGRTMETTNGMSGVWAYSWPQWQKLSAL